MNPPLEDTKFCELTSMWTSLEIKTLIDKSQMGRRVGMGEG